MNRRMPVIPVFAAAAAIFLLSAAPAHAQYAPLSITVTTETAAGTVTTTINSFAPGTTVDIRILPSGEVSIGTTQGGAPGSTVPPTTEPGTTTTEPGTTTTEPGTTTTEPTATTSTTRWPWPGTWDHDELGTFAGVWSAPTGGDDGSQAGGTSVAETLGHLITDERGSATGTFTIPTGADTENSLIAATGVAQDGSKKTVQSEIAARPATAVFDADALGASADTPLADRLMAPLGFIATGLIAGPGAFMLVKRLRRIR